MVAGLSTRTKLVLEVAGPPVIGACRRRRVRRAFPAPSASRCGAIAGGTDGGPNEAGRRTTRISCPASSVVCPLKKRHRLDMYRIQKLIDWRDQHQAVAAVDQDARVPSQGCGIAGDGNDRWCG